MNRAPNADMRAHASEPAARDAINRAAVPRLKACMRACYTLTNPRCCSVAPVGPQMAMLQGEGVVPVLTQACGCSDGCAARAPGSRC